MDLSPKEGESCVKAGLPLITPTYGLKQHVFAGEKAANDDDPVGTGIVSTGAGYSLICPISIEGVNVHVDTCITSIGNEYRHSIDDISKTVLYSPSVKGSTESQQLFSLDVPEVTSRQLTLEFNVHHINRGLFLAPNGRWSKLDHKINRDGLVEVFYKDFKRFTKLKRVSKKAYVEAFDMVLANLLAVHRSSGQLLLARSNDKYKGCNPADIDNRTITAVTDYLADRGYIDLHIGKQNDSDKNSSWCIPLEPLVTLLDHYDAHIRLHAKTQFAVVRDDKKNVIPMYTNRNKRLALIKLGEPVKQHYETWLKHKATIDGAYMMPWLKRKFNNTMELGGRFYGHYQNMSSADRKRILIDGKPTVELDYKSIHMALLYALEGLPVGADPYVIDGHADKRSTFKAICLTLVNSENLPSLKANITRSGKPKVQQESKTYKAKREQYECLRALKLKAKEPWKAKSIKEGFIENIPTGSQGIELLNLIMQRHHPIAHHFGTDNIGLKLQRLDSALIATVLDKLKGIPCLPVHDSIRCKVSDMVQTRNAMIDSFRELHGQEIAVTNDLPTRG